MWEYPSGPNGRVAIIDGVRTPFARVDRGLAHLNALELAQLVVRELAERNDVAGQVDSLVLGSVLQSDSTWYLAREVAIALGWHTVGAYSSEYACGTGIRTAVNSAHEILTGESEVAIAGGAESPSTVVPRVRKEVQRAFGALDKGTGSAAELLALSVGAFVPERLEITEPYSGRTLLSHCEDMITRWEVARADMDDFARRSHHRAAAAWDAGLFDRDVVPVIGEDGQEIARDLLVRQDADLQRLPSLRAVIDGGSITAGTASALTDGASAVLLCSERACEKRGLQPLGFIRSWAFTANDPAIGALMGTSIAFDRSLHRAGLSVADVDVVDFHEAFAGQVLANLRAMNSPEFARDNFVDKTPLGGIAEDRLNVHGGSIALGHPFGATGGRIVMQALHELRRRSGRYAAVSLCAGGSRGASMILEAA